MGKKENFFNTEILDLLGGSKMTQDTGGDVASLLKYQRVVIDLNDALPLDLFFRSQYTAKGFNLYIYSLPMNASLTLVVDVTTRIVTDVQGNKVCNLDRIADYLLEQKVTSADTADDIELVREV